jgi:Uma2 family endonuclease
MNAWMKSGFREAPEPHRFTGEDLLKMQAAGLLMEGGKFELIDGEIIDMPSEGSAHLELKVVLTRHFNRSLPDEIGLVPDGTLRLGERVWPEPDLYLYPSAMLASDVRGPDTLLIIEISDSTLAYDLGAKAAVYRQHGVREYWVLDVEARQTYIHLLDGEWPMKPVGFGELLKPTLVDGFAVCVAELERRK